MNSCVPVLITPIFLLTRLISSTKSRVDAFVRLAAMNKKRRDIEAAILASMRSLEVHTQNIASEMQAMFTGRIEEIYDPIINT